MSAKDVERTFAREPQIPYEVMESVKKIVEDVKVRGDKAVLDYTFKFDGIELKPEALVVRRDEMQVVFKAMPPDIANALLKAAENIKKFQEKQLPQNWELEVEPGVFIGQVYRGLGRVGVYVPGGRAGYPSTMLMAVIPAKVAGVEEVIVCTPPLKDGTINPYVLAAAYVAGADVVFKVGGAQAIAAMAFGTETIPKVDKIVGPGNIYVTAAKVLVSDKVAIDMPAGPSEVVVLADEKADLKLVALDLVAQAEHDPMSFVAAIVTSMSMAEALNKEIAEIAKSCEKADIVNSALNNGAIFVVSDVRQGVEVVNCLAPEHLELMCEDADQLVKQVKNAGTVFIGEYSPVALGDYAAGSNHILPTGGYAKVYSALSVRDFIKSIEYVKCTKEGLSKLASTVLSLAKVEGFPNHAKSVEERLKR
ncbi:MAG: histidinol dehydrogenase [Candidatus Methanomethylicota archaeon]|uniref:Histidinol dehydrogenase n=1 Tax=Thermoproteota archaeon TaxID=2056631 RepID=A0A497EK05_9CREN|nr:MAG: histidinol dehydrogenase [Candidatus Verstraetearchaeota archaeon]